MFSYLWGGKKDAKAKPENEEPELAMRDALDAYGEFATKIDGTLEYKDFLVFRAIIMRQASRSFKPKRDELNEKKLKAFADKDQQTYVKVFREGQVEFQKSVVSITKKACEWIELEASNYQLSMKHYMEDKDKRLEIQTKDGEVRMALEGKEVTESKEDIIKASKFKFKRDMDMFRKLQSLKFTTSPQAQAEIQAIEMSKTSDALMVEFGFDLAHLAKASNHFKLEENEELKSFRKIVVA